MRAMFGVVSLLIALAIVGLVSVRQMRATGHATSTAAANAASVAGLPPPTTTAGTGTGTGTEREQAQQLQKQVADDVAKAMAQGAARTRDADAP